MRIRVVWPNGNEREVEVHNKNDLERFVGWHKEGGHRVDLRPDGDGLALHVLRVADS